MRVAGDPVDPIEHVFKGTQRFQQMGRGRSAIDLDRAAIDRRMAKGAKITMADLTERDACAVTSLLTLYADRLATSGQTDAAERVRRMHRNPMADFIKVVPESQQVDPSISTE